MTLLEAARKILREQRRPMTAQEVIDEALQRGLITTHGKTPAASLAAKLYTHVSRQTNSDIRKVSEPGVQRARRGSVRWAYFSLAASASQPSPKRPSR
jgi:hypothetical protein